MQFHHHGYVSGDPRVLPAAGTGIGRPEELPDETDVLIVGSGPAGMLLAAQMSQFPQVSTRLIERRTGRLELGQADGIQPRSVETFQAFGFAERIIAEAYNIGYMNFWGPDPADPSRIRRTSRTDDYGLKISEFPHLIVNQARVLDYFAEAAAHGPGRIVPDYGVEFVGLEVPEDAGAPVAVTVRHVGGPRAGEERVIRARYVVGCDGARSGVRQAIGRVHVGDASKHAWGVMDVLVDTDFPDWRIKCAINSSAGNILHIPREGGYLSRMYIDLGAVAADDNHRVRETPIEEVVRRANEILHPYTIYVKQVAWHSVYEVGHRVTDGFDDVPEGVDRDPRVFLTGDACHTHSAKAGQGMNVSMQDGFNLGWKLGHVLTGLAPASLLATYGAERRPVAQQLIDFDKEWSSLMARKPEEITDPEDLATYYLATAEFPSGFMTQYGASAIVAGAEHQDLATGFPVGKRLKSAEVVRVADGNVVHLGHHATADGRWRVYAFADESGEDLSTWAEWFASASGPISRHTPAGADPDAVFDAKVIYPRRYEEVEMAAVPVVFRPHSGPLGLMDWEKVYATGPSTWTDVDIFAERGISASGAVVVVRPDQYVAAVLPLAATAELGEFLAGAFRPAG
ncbi:FAD-dependent monooxygenase [Microbacterium sp. EYE_5]|uniref:FAD-dependent monooxygenase n=1 Tax=unclassified Microbacterium TaxID=2609290 RepID=UPI0020040C6C|nr:MULTISPECIES: FAD-dependent monooxygenase [unclassified Microbacterium]MCK6081608.1 FAD-dependent monooxygenase [Microbacterium sp. EYE_382]MCK6086878.1 FAD-dependent monooxygenase [Microbacterium sp. EYE_384]MCK6123624.1 FAD-dependent monooxygenase [Microbacterium sp. EYE_80]MCK6126533.1 FAD-dependent monooxygenase [Microbacterium sp. EYE_79]MCK6142562.1 FAD-dependent monooxygenase [Microbacterium sp. EYE_39]